MAPPASKAPEPLLRVGRYVLFDEIASGGMASVHFGRVFGGAGFAKTVAVKRLHRQFAKDPEFRAMFLDEARLASRIRHTNVVQPVDLLASEDELFVALDYVQGESLYGLLTAANRKQEIAPIGVSAAIVSGLLHGLHAAHEAKDDRGVPLGIVHRDVSPHNVLIGTDGVPRVIDFGIAKASTRVQSTQDGQVKGKVAYMAPEQLLGTNVGQAADLWAAGVILWELLAGRRLHDGLETVAIFSRITRGELPALLEANPNAPRGLAAVVARALMQDPQQRFASAREMAIAIESTGAFAPPTAVAAWVERLVGEKLQVRAKQLAAIEAVDLDGEIEIEEIDIEPATGFPRSTFEAPRSLPATVAPRSLARPPSPPPPPPVPPRRPASSTSSLGRTLASPVYSPLADQGSGDLDDRPTPDQPSLAASRAPAPPPPPPSLRKPEVVLANVNWTDPTAPKPATTPAPSARGRVATGLAVLVVLAFAGGLAALPRVAQAQAETFVRRLGFVMTSADATATLGLIQFRDVTLIPQGLSGVKIHFATLSVRTNGLSPAAMTITDATVGIEGRAAEMLPSYLSWQHKYGENWTASRLPETRIDGGSLLWKGLFGPDSELRSMRVSGQLSPAESTLEGMDLAFGELTVSSAGQKYGPWRGGIQQAGHLFLSPSAAVPEVTLRATPNGVSVGLSITKDSIEHFGFPPDTFRGFDAGHSQIAASGVFDIDFATLQVRADPRSPSGTPGQVPGVMPRGQGRISLWGVKPEGMAPTEGYIEVVANGQGVTQGTFALGQEKDGRSGKTTGTGTATVETDGPRFTFVGNPLSRPCLGGGESAVTANVAVGPALDPGSPSAQRTPAGPNSAATAAPGVHLWIQPRTACRVH